MLMKAISEASEVAFLCTMVSLYYVSFLHLSACFPYFNFKFRITMGSMGRPDFQASQI